MPKSHVQGQPPDHVLSFIGDADGHQLFVHADAAGLDLLIGRLTRLRAHLDRSECEHEHLFTTAWSGSGDLSTRGAGKSERVILHVKIYAWTAEWGAKHQLKDATADTLPNV